MTALKLDDIGVSDEVADFLVFALRSKAASLLNELPDIAKEYAQSFSQAAESIATAAVRAGVHPIVFANSEYRWGGGCPECGSTGTWVHVGSEQWVVCHEHRLAWCLGDAIDSGWRNLQPEQHEANRQMIESYTVLDDDAIPAGLCLACGLAAGQHERWCIHAHEHRSARSPAEALLGDDTPDWLQVAMPAGVSDETDQDDDPEVDLEVWGDL